MTCFGGFKTSVWIRISVHSALSALLLSILISSLGCRQKEWKSEPYWAFHDERCELMADAATVKLPISKVKANLPAYQGKLILAGRTAVTDLCARDGCWLKLTDIKDGAEIFVLMPSESGGNAPRRIFGLRCAAVGHDIQLRESPVGRDHPGLCACPSPHDGSQLWITADVVRVVADPP